MRVIFKFSHLVQIIVCSVLMLLSSAVHAQIKEKITYYDVVVEAPEDMANVLRETTPVIRSGNKFYGQTRYSINWTYDSNFKNNFCRVAKPKVTATVLTTLPKLISSNPLVIEKWEPWYQDLYAHQQNHKQHAIDTVKTLKKKLKKLKRQRDCQTLFENAKVVAKQSINASLQQDVDYDQETQFGFTEGAWSVFVEQ